jgi:hypothetical protein
MDWVNSFVFPKYCKLFPRNDAGAMPIDDWCFYGNWTKKCCWASMSKTHRHRCTDLANRRFGFDHDDKMSGDQNDSSMVVGDLCCIRAEIFGTTSSSPHHEDRQRIMMSTGRTTDVSLASSTMVDNDERQNDVCDGTICDVLAVLGRDTHCQARFDIIWAYITDCATPSIQRQQRRLLPSC